MYLDTAYIAKYYLREPDSAAVRRAIRNARTRVTSEWANVEIACVIHRHVREGRMSDGQGRMVLDRFWRNVDEGLWQLAPITSGLLFRCSALVTGLPANVFLRAGDAVHLTTALEYGETEVWTSDRHLLAAAPYFGLIGRKA